MKEIEARLIALGVVLPGLATFFTGLRCWVRYTRRTPLGLDDFFVIVAACLVWGMGITQILGMLDFLTFMIRKSRLFAFRCYRRGSRRKYRGTAEW